MQNDGLVPDKEERRAVHAIVQQIRWKVAGKAIQASRKWPVKPLGFGYWRGLEDQQPMGVVELQVDVQTRAGPKIPKLEFDDERTRDGYRIPCGAVPGTYAGAA